MKKLTLIFILITISLNLSASDRFISGVFVNPVSRYFNMQIGEEIYDWDVEEAFIQDIYDIISGMIYGWKFHYEPADKERQIEEIFEVTPVASIKRDDPNMRLKDNWVEEFIMYQNIVYYLSQFQIDRIKSWNSSSVPSSYGEGEASSYTETGKDEALKEALKNSIKREFQSRGKDKPRSITGQMLLKETPRLYINSGLYHYQIEVLILYKNINEYQFH